MRTKRNRTAAGRGTALVVGALMAVGTMVGSGGIAAASTPTAFARAVDFGKVAYTWHAKWDSTKHAAIGDRAGSRASAKLDRLLDDLSIVPQSYPDEVTWAPSSGKEESSKALANGIRRIKVKLTVDNSYVGGSHGKFTVVYSADLAVEHGAWQVLGVGLPLASGPSKYCSLSTDVCSVYPAGSR